MSLAAVESRPVDAADHIFVTIAGKLVDQRKNEGVYYSTVVRPAPDQFSSPMPFEIRSHTQLGMRDELVSVECKLTGFFKRQYQLTDQNTGEVRRVKPIMIALDALV